MGGHRLAMVRVGRRRAWASRCDLECLGSHQPPTAPSAYVLPLVGSTSFEPPRAVDMAVRLNMVHHALQQDLLRLGMQARPALASLVVPTGRAPERWAASSRRTFPTVHGTGRRGLFEEIARLLEQRVRFLQSFECLREGHSLEPAQRAVRPRVVLRYPRMPRMLIEPQGSGCLRDGLIGLTRPFDRPLFQRRPIRFHLLLAQGTALARFSCFKMSSIV